MIPVIALVGRPNVGKSTLFNRLTKSRDALVADLSGLTRDRKYGDGTLLGRKFVVIDTGGLTGIDEGIEAETEEQSLIALAEADLVLFLVDSKTGLLPPDLAIVENLRRKGSKFFVVANKVDGLDPEIAIADFYQVGTSEIFAISASHGRGIKSLMESALNLFPKDNDDESDASDRTKICFAGRPNVGKSTIVNSLFKEDRVVVFDQPGTTRDSIYIDFERGARKYTLIDTAGIRKRKNIKLAVEKFSIVKTLQAINDAHVVICVMDCMEGIVDQDLHLLGKVLEAGRCLVIALNKADRLSREEREYVKNEIKRRLKFVGYADIHFVSGLKGTGIKKLLNSVDRAYKAATTAFPTSKLTYILEGAIEDHQPPLAKGRRIKLRFAHSGGHNPPIIVIHGNQTDAVPAHYTKYLEGVFRRELGLHGTPVKIGYKSSSNPYAAKSGERKKKSLKKDVRVSKSVSKKNKVPS